ncbi:hypothetical protein [Nonomuraea sp. NPDC049684]|uniref:hypothetical protein n=1 Tax=unclassified Nonomuraea TaxID=2593643 RepID=UPI00378B8AAF
MERLRRTVPAVPGARQWQRHVFDDLTASRDEPDRRRFGACLGRLADDVGAWHFGREFR